MPEALSPSLLSNAKWVKSHPHAAALLTEANNAATAPAMPVTTPATPATDMATIAAIPTDTPVNTAPPDAKLPATKILAANALAVNVATQADKSFLDHDVVAQEYKNVLGRDAKPEELTGWDTRARQLGLSLDDVKKQIDTSDEAKSYTRFKKDAQADADSLGIPKPINRLTDLNADPALAHVLTETDLDDIHKSFLRPDGTASNMTPDALKAEVKADFTEGPSFYMSHPKTDTVYKPAGFIPAYYHEYLGRDAKPEELDAWGQQNKSNDEIRAEIAASPEAQQYAHFKDSAQQEASPLKLVPVDLSSSTPDTVTPNEDDWSRLYRNFMQNSGNAGGADLFINSTTPLTEDNIGKDVQHFYKIKGLSR